MRFVEAVVSSVDGTVVLRDAAEDAVLDTRRAAENARQGGSQRGGGQITGVAGGALLIRCADQYSRPTLSIHVHEHWPPCAADHSWVWLDQAAISLPSGHLILDSPDVQQTGWDGDVFVGPPGRYALLVGHRGRKELRDAAGQVRMSTLDAPIEAMQAAWNSLQGIEQYSIELWRENGS